jgi:hypothetical protein
MCFAPFAFSSSDRNHAAIFVGDVEEPLVKALLLAADAFIAQLTPERFQEMTYCRESATDAWKQVAL